MGQVNISIVVPSFNEAENITVLFEAIKKSLGEEKFEVIFVNDGSVDNTIELLKDMVSRYKNVKYVSFSKNFGHQAALRAGLKYASGDAVISMDADMQHPPSLLPKIIKKWRAGYEIVYTVRKDDGDVSGFKKVTSRGFYRLMNFLSGLSLEEGAADFRLLDRKVVDVINAQSEADIFLRGYINWIGFKQIGVPYTPNRRFSGKSKYTLKKMISFASNGVTQFSIKPLRLAHLMAVFAFVLSFLYIIYAGFTALNGHAIPGWLSLVVLFVFLQGVQFMLLGMIGEYLGRTFLQTKHRPEYIVSDTNIK